MRAPLRRLWLLIHRWIGLALGPILALTALLGAVLVVALPLDRHAHPALFTARSAGDAAQPLEPLRQRLAAEFGPDANFTLRPPRQPGDTLWVLVRGKWDGTLYLDPATGAEQGRRGTHEGAYNLLFELHSTGGAVLGLLLAVSVATGAYMAWRPLGNFISGAMGQQPLKPPVIAKGAASGPRLPLDALVARAQQAFPGQPIGYIQVPGQSGRPVRVRFRLPDDPHPNGIGSVWLNPATGEVLAARKWQDLDTGNGAVAVIYPLHTGALGGLPHQVLTALLGLALGGLGLSGIWLWWRRRAATARHSFISRKPEGGIP
ncbi:PepSY-associated TM helix domain-containing protein [Variovorax sp. H27-G14]|uniref:PepSY-associated TM helix domain-containing protein n=1 Tax=Variovorax sp. H27-G14 TaxID=3111914 RepID=UPI0038FCD3E2